MARIEHEPQFDMKRLFGHLATADVALIKLAEPLPARIPPVRIGSETESVAVGDTLVVVGYGDSVRGEGRTGGIVRAAPLTVTGQPGNLQIRLVDPATKGMRAGLGACTGDSGAPAFRDEGGGFKVIGVVSWSTGPNLSAGCGGLTGITPLALSLRRFLGDAHRAVQRPFLDHNQTGQANGQADGGGHEDPVKGRRQIAVRSSETFQRYDRRAVGAGAEHDGAEKRNDDGSAERERNLACRSRCRAGAASPRSA